MDRNMRINEKCFKPNRYGGIRKGQVILSEIEIDGAVILEGLDVYFYYKPFKWEYWQNFWKDEGNSMLLWRQWCWEI